MHAANFCGTVSRSGNRHCPSPAIFAPSSFPSLSSKTVLVGSENNFEGRQNPYAVPRMRIAVIHLPRRVFKTRQYQEADFFKGAATRFKTGTARDFKLLVAGRVDIPDKDSSARKRPTLKL